jgi:hypothetical protein
MEYTSDDIQRAISKKGWSIKQKTDELLRMDCCMYAYLGSDSKRSEIEETRRSSKRIYKAIKEIDEVLGNTIINAIDS